MTERIAVLSVVGRHKSGKTTLIEGLLGQLRRRGLRVATLKHDAHGFDIDIPGKDSWRHRQAGAELVVIASPGRLALVQELRREEPLAALLELAAQRAPGIDLILTEGYRTGPLPKIEVVEHGRGAPLTAGEPALLALAADRLPFEEAPPGVPCFDRNDYAGLAELLLARLPELRRLGPLPPTRP
ncbi:MAG: molybdopterin-guanine dinucleotide biosynthesis protein B [Clostridia bacterium]|nr:molybdopterin-guanine dinucleotide biosynthesis protein B [Clostridia bacterium]MCL6521741.1 molybdopterin-guanine dinucleotide biosynthesis protein B [Bacillota bacterium]